MKNVLYVFAGEKAQGAEIVIERLMISNIQNFSATHLVLSPGEYAEQLLAAGKPYTITQFAGLKKLNRPLTSAFLFYINAVKNYFWVSHKVHRYIKTNNIKLVHANTIVPAAYLFPLVLLYRIFSPSVKWYWSDHDLKYFSKIENILANACARSFDGTLAVSRAVKRKYPINFKKVSVLYNGLDPEVFKYNLVLRTFSRSEWGINDRSIVIGIAASINPDKGQLQLIKIFNELNMRYPDIYLVIAGSYAQQFPGYSQEVKNLILASPKVYYIGFINDMVAFYNGCDIVVNNSNNYRSESLGTTIYEAMSCEKIVLAADTGGTSEIISDKRDGFLFKPESSADLKAKLAFIIDGWSSMLPIQQAAKEKVINQFEIQQMVRKYNQIIHNNEIF